MHTHYFVLAKINIKQVSEMSKLLTGINTFSKNLNPVQSYSTIGFYRQDPEVFPLSY